jgi:hypothetical protein
MHQHVEELNRDKVATRTPQKVVESPLGRNNENISAIRSKPQINPTKSKPFNVRETPKKIQQKQQLQGHSQFEGISQESPKPRDNHKKINSVSLYDSEEQAIRPTHKNKEMSESEVKVLSNTHLFNTQNEGMDALPSHNNRKSMNNLNINEKLRSEDLSNQRSNYNDSKSSAMKAQNVYNQPVANSASHTSLSQMTGIMDLGPKKTSTKAQTSMHTQEERRHETIKVDQVQKTKPLLSKTSQEINKNATGTMSSFDERSIKPNLTAQSIVNSQPQSSEESDHEEAKQLPSHPIAISKQDEDTESEGDEEGEQEQEEEESENDQQEFPVALNGLVFSFLPQDVAERLNEENDAKKRTQAIQETENLIKKQFSRPNEDFNIYVTDICRKM